MEITKPSVIYGNYLICNGYFMNEPAGLLAASPRFSDGKKHRSLALLHDMGMRTRGNLYFEIFIWQQKPENFRYKNRYTCFGLEDVEDYLDAVLTKNEANPRHLRRGKALLNAYTNHIRAQKRAYKEAEASARRLRVKTKKGIPTNRVTVSSFLPSNKAR
jgi:hypothetical protein